MDPRIIKTQLCLQGDLRELVRELHDHGMKAVADIVINHRCAHFQVQWRHVGHKLAMEL